MPGLGLMRRALTQAGSSGGQKCWQLAARTGMHTRVLGGLLQRVAVPPADAPKVVSLLLFTTFVSPGSYSLVLGHANALQH